MSQSHFELGYGIPRSESVEPSLPQQFPSFNPQGNMFNAAGTGLPPATMQQLQYQQGLLSRTTPPLNNNFIPGMQAGFAGYNSPSPSVEPYRSQNLVNGSPMQPAGNQMPTMSPASQSAFGGSGFPVGMGMGGGFGYGGIGGMQNMAYMQEQVNTRRGRVSSPMRPSSLLPGKH
jgi:protein JSN1